VIESGIRKRDTESVVELVSDVPLSTILCGHDHLPGSRELPDGRVIVNPGSVGLQAYEDDTPWPHAVATGSPHARFAVITRLSGDWRVAHIRLEYDWKVAAHVATNNGRDDWAHWLRTGLTTQTGCSQADSRCTGSGHDQPEGGA
jgi:hypothetical protein